MTILVYIQNESAHGRSLEVVEVSIDRKGGRREEGTVETLEPGMKRSFFVHLLRELIVREVEPR